MSAPTVPRVDGGAEVAPRSGSPTRRYDLVKEFVVALVAVALLTTLLAAVFSSPDVPPVTIEQWARTDPVDFLTTAASELAGTSDTAQYGPPYTHTPDAAQRLGPVSLQSLAGVRHPIDTATDFVLAPLQEWTGADPTLTQALATYQGASAAQRQTWLDAYTASLGQATVSGHRATVPAGAYGPVGDMMSGLDAMARSGALDGALLRSPQFFRTDYTPSLLFLADGSYLGSLAGQQHLLGDQWGMMNETGNYPGQAWLWLYTFWYQIPPFASSGNADALVWGLMVLLTLGLLFLPFIPGLRSIPEHLPVHRWIWRDHYRRLAHERAVDAADP